MATYRVAIVGARRGLLHAQGYEGIDNMEVVAFCEKDDARRAEALAQFDVHGYTNYEEMLRKERPDVVHAVTDVTVPRETWMPAASEAGVKALVIEKPLAVRPGTFQRLVDAQRETGLNVLVCHNRRCLPFGDKLRELLADGLGDVHFVRASSQGGLWGMVTHLIDLCLFAVGDVRPVATWGMVEGGGPYARPSESCPEAFFAVYTFPNGARAFVEDTAVGLGQADFPGGSAQSQVDIWATNGRCWYRDHGTWGYQIEGMAEPVTHPTHWREGDLQAQHLFNREIGTSLDTGATSCPTFGTPLKMWPPLKCFGTWT